jgi:hypothetical protein
LLSFDREPLTRSPTVEVAHEALLAQWGRLRAWISERREDLLLHRRLVEAAEEWEDAGRAADYLPREGRLAQFEAWAAGTDLALTTGEREFLAEARAAADEAARTRSRVRRALHDDGVRHGGVVVRAALSGALPVISASRQGCERLDGFTAARGA